MSKDMYLKSNLTYDEIKKIVDEIMDANPNSRVVSPDSIKAQKKSKSRVKKLVTVVSER